VNPGAVVASSFEILRTIGSGGMGGRVPGAAPARRRDHRAQDPAARAAARSEAVTRFRREGRAAAAALRSPHAARIFDVGETEQGQPFIVMEYLEGCDLMHEIDTRGALPVVEALSFVAQACHAMIEAHELGIVHRDLKPPNIFLATEGHRRVAKVLDFRHLEGCSRSTTRGSPRRRCPFGSPLYMSPEQIRSTKLVDQRSDVWSLGVILYEALTGEPPFMGETPGALAVVVISVEPHLPASHKNPQIPSGLDDVIAGALQKDPKKRYASVRELLRALEDFLPQTDSRPLRHGARASGPLAEPPTAPAPSHAMAPSAPRAFTTAAPAVTSPPVPQPPVQAEQPPLPTGRRAQTLVMEPSVTLEPASRDLGRERDRGRDRIGLILAAIFIPLGAAAFGFAIWLYAKRSGAEKTPRTDSVVAHELTSTPGTPASGAASATTATTASSSEPEPSADDRAGRRVRQRLTQAEGEADGAADGQEATAACRALSVERRRLPRPQGLGAVPVHRRTIA
jgi:serine/threonine protein kinase